MFTTQMLFLSDNNLFYAFLVFCAYKDHSRGIQKKLILDVISSPCTDGKLQHTTKTGVASVNDKQSINEA